MNANAPTYPPGLNKFGDVPELTGLTIREHMATEFMKALLTNTNFTSTQLAATPGNMLNAASILAVDAANALIFTLNKPATANPRVKP